MNKETAAEPLLCPSARPEMEDSRVFGVVRGTVEEPRLGYMAETLPVTPEILFLSGPVPPSAIFRISAPCAGHACQHFDGSQCRLATRIVQMLPPVTEDLPPCRIRPTCRWWRQEGKAACLRCPQIVSQAYQPTETLKLVADPQTPLD